MALTTIDGRTLAEALAKVLAGNPQDGMVALGGGAVSCVWGAAADVRVQVDDLDLDPVLVDGRPLAAWLRARKDHDVTIKVDDGRLVAHAETATFECRPSLDDREPWAELDLPELDIDLAMLGRVAFAASPDASRPILMGVMITPEGVAATDSYRAAYVHADLAERASIIVPAPAVRLAAKLCGTDDSVPVRSDGRVAQFDAPGVQVRCRLTQGDPPGGVDEIAWGVNPKFLTDAIDALGEERVVMGMTDPIRPVVIRSGADLHLLMPVRLLG